MATEHQETREEEAFWQLLSENWETLSQGTRAIIGEVESALHARHLIGNYCDGFDGYEETIEKMRLVAAELTPAEREFLKEFVRHALVACASIDPFDWDTLAGYRSYRGNLTSSTWRSTACSRICSPRGSLAGRPGSQIRSKIPIFRSDWGAATRLVEATVAIGSKERSRLRPWP